MKAEVGKRTERMHSEGLDLEGEGFSSRLPKGGERERESLIDFVYGYIASPPPSLAWAVFWQPVALPGSGTERCIVTEITEKRCKREGSEQEIRRESSRKMK